MIGQPPCVSVYVFESTWADECRSGLFSQSKQHFPVNKVKIKYYPASEGKTISSQY